MSALLRSIAVAAVWALLAVALVAAPAAQAAVGPALDVTLHAPSTLGGGQHAFDVTVDVGNSGDEAATGVTTRLDLDPGLTITEGANPGLLGRIEPGQTVSQTWIVHAPAQCSRAAYDLDVLVEADNTSDRGASWQVVVPADCHQLGGLVTDTSGRPVAGATVSLVRADTEDGTYTTPDADQHTGSIPQSSASDGTFRWDVVPGWYRVTAHLSSCDGQGTDDTSSAIQIPPATGNVTLVPTCRQPNPPSGPVVRLAGSSRIGTAIAVSQQGFADGAAGGAVVARADGYADALAGTPLATSVDGPLLLTGRDRLDDRVATELRRVLPSGSTVHLLGGEAALSSQVATDLTKLGYDVIRYAGGNRFETAVLVADNALGAPDVVLLATGLDFPDALSAGAAAANLQGAVLLTAGDQLPTATQDYLDRHADTSRYAIGGPAAAADPGATPIVGSDRVSTAVAVAERLYASPTVVGVATAAGFPDALAGGALVASRGGPVLLTDPSRLSDAVATYVRDRSSVDTGMLFGGTAALSSQVEDDLRAIIAP